MMMMKNPVILVTCIMLFLSVAVLAQNSFGPDECCFDFYTKRLPKNKVVSYKYTDTRCTKEGVLFTMRNGAKFCVKPSEPWVQKVISQKLNITGSQQSD